GAGSTINMGNNVVSGVATGVADTDAVNVAQLKANAATVVAGKNVSVDVAENASTGKTFTVHSEKTTVSGTGPVTVKATSDAANHTTNYNVEFDSSKAAEQTDLTYKANGKDAKKVKLSEGLDFTNGKGTKASVGENGKVTIDANVTDIAAGNNIQVNKGDDGKYTISSTNTITTVKGKDGSAAKVTTATGSTDTNKIYEVDVNVDGKTIVNENGTLQAKGWKTKVVKGEGEVEGSSEETVNGSDTVNYIAGKNVKLVQNGKNFTIATKDNVTFKDTTTTNLSVTTGGKVDMGNNKVTNVAEGTENTDAVNVKQLKDFKSEVAEGGLTFAGNSGTAHKAKLNTTVNIKGGEGNTDADQFDKGKNVITAVNGNTVTVSIKKTPEVEGINIIDTTGKVKVKLTQTAEGLKVSDGNNNATRITNVKAGEKDTDAVNVKQLNAAKTEVTAGDNIDVRSSTGANGQTIYKVSANDTSAAVKGGSDHVKVTKAANTHKDGSTTVTDYTIDLSNKTKEDIKKGVDAHTEVTTKGLTFNADTGTTGVKKLASKVAVNGDGKNITTTADENGVKVSMKDDIKVNSVTAKEVKVGDVNINENGINAGGKRITNVAPGKDGTDAVNVNQLKYVAGNISNQINNVDKGLRAGIAGALASGGLYHVTTPGKSMVSVGAGAYRGQNALAVGYSRLSDNGKVGVKFTVNSNSQGHSGASASVGYQW
ncbi:MAG: YadA-like family protein, partial [Haemophilus paraphrohaemolyticus]|uniref:YadA family autotransporter adhesin n=1 Tax=Haemophilus paraphrohaemolyticus TaxID=736 RepID=UPI001EBA6B75